MGGAKRCPSTPSREAMGFAKTSTHPAKPRRAGTRERSSQTRPTEESVEALPVRGAAEHAAEGAALYLELVRSRHRNGGVVVLVGTGIVDAAGPFAVVRR